MHCTTHPGTPSTARCQKCGGLFCEACLEPGGRRPLCKHCGQGTPRRSRGGMRLWVLLVIPATIAPLVSNGLADHLGRRHERVAIESLQAIGVAQGQFRERDSEGDQVLDYATSLGELSAAGLIDTEIAGGEKGDYVFGLSGSTFDWLATATPIKAREGDWNFLICYRGVVHWAAGYRAHCGCGTVQ